MVIGIADNSTTELQNCGNVKTEMDDQKRNSMIREAFKIHQDEFGHSVTSTGSPLGNPDKTVKSVIQRPFNDVDLRYVVMK